ncbi:MAG: hypothetical protein WCG29_02425 [Desulfomonile sp.]|jgi:hypothetical protein
MNKTYCFTLLICMVAWSCTALFRPSLGMAMDIRGAWIGNAKGTIFGADGSVTITHQRGEDIYGIVEGGNFFGKAKFEINAKIRGNHIFGVKEGHTFNGLVYPDGTIRGLFRAVDGDSYQVFLQRPYSQWGWGMPPGLWDNQ